jgi:hypothetical protein
MVDGATMNTVLIVGLKVIFFITLIIGPVSEVRPPASPEIQRLRCQDFSRTYEAFLAAEFKTMGFHRAMTVYAVSGAPHTHKCTFLT